MQVDYIIGVTIIGVVKMIALVTIRGSLWSEPLHAHLAVHVDL